MFNRWDGGVINVYGGGEGMFLGERKDKGKGFGLEEK